MKTITKIGVYGMAAGLAAVLSGCASEKIFADYAVPAEKVKSVGKVNVLALKVNAKVEGNQAGDSSANAGLIKQLLASRLYKEGFYQVTDNIWADAESVADLHKGMEDLAIGHGYSLFTAGGSKPKAVLEIALDMTLDSKQTTKDMSFTLKTMPYTIQQPKKAGDKPSSSPNVAGATVDKVTRPVTVYELIASGKLVAKFVGVNGGDAPVPYEREIAIAVPEDDRFGASQPTQLKALAQAITPAIEQIVKDISPTRESRPLEAVKGGDKRVVHLLNAKVFSEVETVVKRLALIGKAVSADFENLGIAMEAIGDFDAAKDAYKEAIALNPEAKEAKVGLQRVADALAGVKKIRKTK